MKVLTITNGGTIQTDDNYKWRNYPKVPLNRIPYTIKSNTLKSIYICKIVGCPGGSCAYTSIHWICYREHKLVTPEHSPDGTASYQEQTNLFEQILAPHPA